LADIFLLLIWTVLAVAAFVVVRWWLVQATRRRRGLV